MPFVYTVAPGVLQSTSATAVTAWDQLFIKTGSSSSRNVGLQSLMVVGRGAGLTAISGISFRVRKYTATSATGGVATTPAPADIGMQASKATAGYSVTNGFTAGSGGPTLLLSIGCGAAGPGGWVAPNPDSVKTIEAGTSTTQSLDVWTESGTVSLNYEVSAEVVE